MGPSIDLDAVDFLNSNTYRSHPCLRDCVAGRTLTCYYEFNIEFYETLSKACYDCPYNQTDCFRPHCISTDGIRRSVLVVNRMMPGPAIEVMEYFILIAYANNIKINLI